MSGFFKRVIIVFFMLAFVSAFSAHARVMENPG